MTSAELLEDNSMIRDIMSRASRSKLRLDMPSVRFTLSSLKARTLKTSSSTLVLHFDVNETIMVGDPAGGDTFDDCLSKMIAKNVYIRQRKRGNDLSAWEWSDGSSLLSSSPVTSGQSTQNPPPLITTWNVPSGLMSFYKSPFKKGYVKRFLSKESPGHVFGSFAKCLKENLRLPSEKTVDKRLTHDGKHYFILPAFFRTLAKLDESGKDFRVVIRTFGTDGADIAKAINAWAEGKHPMFEGRRFPKYQIDLDKHLFIGRYDKSSNMYSVRRANADGSASPTSPVFGESSVVAMFESKVPKVQVLQDHYQWWKSHDYSPSAGKPLWIDWSQKNVHHIFFDDNIHNDASDSIVSIRIRRYSNRLFRPLSGESIRLLQGYFLVRVPTVCPILDHMWFLKQIEQCEKNRKNLFFGQSTGLRTRLFDEAGGGA